MHRLSTLVLLLLMAPLWPGIAYPADRVPADVDADDFWDELGDEYADTNEVLVDDPLESLNRKMFWLNDRMYFLFFKPVARAYRVVPKGVRVSVTNFFSNITTPIRVINSLLQLKFRDAGTESLRFVVNTTVGIGGLFDPADKYGGIRKRDEDFGQTLGHYGAGHGVYLVIPMLGPSSVRDGFGDIVDAFMDPTVFAVEGEDRIPLRLYKGVNTLSLDKDTYESIKRDSLDPYTFMKNAYAQHRAGKVER